MSESEGKVESINSQGANLSKEINSFVAKSVEEATKEKDAELAKAAAELAAAKSENESLKAGLEAQAKVLAETRRLLIKCHDWFLDHLRRKGRSFGIDNFNEVRTFLGLGAKEAPEGPESDKK